MPRLPFCVFALICTWCFSVPASASSRVLAVLPLDTTHAERKLSASARVSLEEALRDVATNALAGAGWTIMTGENTLQILSDNGLDASHCSETSCHLAMARELKADLFLSGSVQWVDGLLVASIRLIESKTGRPLNAIRLEGATATALRKSLEQQGRTFLLNEVIGVEKVESGVSPSGTPGPLNLAELPCLDAATDVLTAFDTAVSVDARGRDNPKAAADAWRHVASLRRDNPYEKFALERARQWDAYLARQEGEEKARRLAEQRKVREAEPPAKVIVIESPPPPVARRVEVLVDNCDDQCTILLNNAEVAAVGLGEKSGWVDVSSFLSPRGRSNAFRFKVVNRQEGWTYRFRVRIDGRIAWEDECGTVYQRGCNNEDRRRGLVRDLSYQF